MSKERYRCAQCKKVYKHGWSEEEANQEAVDNYGVSPQDHPENFAVVCDDCYKKLVSEI